MCEQTVLIVGEVFVDTHLDILTENCPLVRLGGIFHSARAFSALGVNFVLAYYAPDYLDDDINLWSLKLNTKGCYKLGSINCAPNVMLINESTEAGNQGYYNILKDQAQYVDTASLSHILDIVTPTDILLFPGRYNMLKIMKEIESFPGRVHIDFHYDSEQLLQGITRKIDTVIISTSAELFKENCGGTLVGLLDFFNDFNIHQFLVKENRGGAFCYVPEESMQFDSAAYHVPTMHSVGVGDVFNSVFITSLFGNDISKRMRLAALCAAKYAETMSFTKYKKNSQLVLDNIDELIELIGIRLPWEDRKKINIYLAAPDFPDLDTGILDALYASLCYHNFSPRRPIQENGLAKKDLDYQSEHVLYQKDVDLLSACDLLIAVLLNNDPGTLVELGMFKQSGKPTIIFDPNHYCNNMFVRHTPDYICHTISDVIESTYLCMRRS